METIIRKGTIFIFLLASCSIIGAFRPDCERPVKSNAQKKEAKHESNRNGVAIKLLNSAERWMEVRELTGNNDHPMITKAMNLCGLDGDKGYPWCAAAQAEIHYKANITAPRSARVVDWFQYNLVWVNGWPQIPEQVNTTGMVGGLYYQSLGRLGHIVLIAGEDKNNFYTLEGNTNIAGSREGDGFYRKVRSKKSISALADYCINGKAFMYMYDKYLPQ